ncbi:zinc finger ring fyve phd-type protein [Diplodia corticola]|uniref:Zinc finger ring fyve phd-type protein n=1 Tax=Diplodia corticola TaxID=236234 RepID=A0A1J9S5Y5_9PEZI|nr:zinc finger ring fyve phd-type protein [Diplodia corticola]OJD40363.1 zinc finger ring fyve phd-type protein [Diplodia corticola]
MATAAFDWFVWEDTAGLDHHCPVCAVPESHTHTLLNICLGEHVMPCSKYHQNLFWPSKTHECDPCNRSDEEHWKRHKAIAASLRDLEQAVKPEINLPLTSMASTERPQRRRKDNKLEKKMGKAMSRRPPADNISNADVDRVAAAFHPDAAGEDSIELDDPDFPENLSWDSRGYAWYRRKMDATNTVIPPDFNELAAAALRRLDVELPSSAGSKQKLTKKQKTIGNQLLVLAKADYEHAWNEEVETAKRRGGFLRFINRAVLDRIKDCRKQRLEFANRRRGEDDLGQAVVPDADEAQPELGEAEPEVDEPQPELDEAQPEVDDPQPEPDDPQPEPDNPQPEPDNPQPQPDDPQPETSQSDVHPVHEAVPLPKRPEDIALPPADKQERDEWDNEATMSRLRRMLNNWHVTRSEGPLYSRDFFQAGVYNMFNHDIWAEPRDSPLEPLPDPEKAYIDTTGIHQVGKHPRHDDWKAFTKHFRRYMHHPSELIKYYNPKANRVDDFGTPSTLSDARVVVPMGVDGWVTTPKPVLEISTALATGTPGCPDGHIGMMMHDAIVPFCFDSTFQAPSYLPRQFERGDGFLAEQCWQYHLIGRLNAQNLAVRDGLRLKHYLSTYDSPQPVTFTAAETDQFARLHGPLNDPASLPRACICRGLPTERMIACDVADCAYGVAPFHARCVDVAFAPAEGERHFCGGCAIDSTWFLDEPGIARAADPLIALYFEQGLFNEAADQPAVRWFVCETLRLVRRQVGPLPFDELAPVPALVEDVLARLSARMDANDGSAIGPAEIANGIVAERTVAGVMRAQQSKFLDLWHTVTRDAAADNGERPQGRQEGEPGLEWHFMSRAPTVRRLYHEDHFRSVDAVVRRREQQSRASFPHN